MIRKHIIFSGCVQGVGFRWRARKAAEMYGVTGWVRNDWNGKLASMSIEKKRSQLTAKTFTADRIKTESPEIFSAIDCIGEAIEQGKQISFQYIDYLPDKTMVLRHNGKV